MRADKEFTAAEIAAGGMGIAGVVSGFEELADKDRNRNAENLQLTILEEREDYQLTPMPEIRDQIGKEGYDAMMKQYQDDGILSGETLQTIKSKVKVRFLILVRIQEDVTQPVHREQVEERRDANKRITQEAGVRCSVSRQIKVTAHVYDLQRAKSVWSGLITTNGYSQVFYKPEDKGDAGALALLALVGALSGKEVKGEEQKSIEEIYPAPPAPQLFKMLPEAFEGFADQLPEE